MKCERVKFKIYKNTFKGFDRNIFSFDAFGNIISHECYYENLNEILQSLLILSNRKCEITFPYTNLH